MKGIKKIKLFLNNYFYLWLLDNGEEFSKLLKIFQKYLTSTNKSYSTIKGLMDFYEKEQNETLTSEEEFKNNM